MDKNTEITTLAREIMIDITDNRIPLHNALLKSSRLSLLVNIPSNINLFLEWAKYAEQNSFIVSSFQANIEAAKDPNVSLSSSNPHQYVSGGFGNTIERQGLRTQAANVVKLLAHYRSQAYNFSSDIYQKWQFGNIAQSIFEMKRERTELPLKTIFTDVENRLNTIEVSIRGNSDEQWKNAVVSCRTLLMDIADILNPSKNDDDKSKYINRLKDVISIKSKTKSKFLKSYLEEVKKRIEYTMNLTQGSAHQDRPLKHEAEDVVLYTYLIISELIEIHNIKINGKNTDM